MYIFFWVSNYFIYFLLYFNISLTLIFVAGDLSCICFVCYFLCWWPWFMISAFSLKQKLVNFENSSANKQINIENVQYFSLTLFWLILLKHIQWVFIFVLQIQTLILRITLLRFSIISMLFHKQLQIAYRNSYSFLLLSVFFANNNHNIFQNLCQQIIDLHKFA